MRRRTTTSVLQVALAVVAITTGLIAIGSQAADPVLGQEGNEQAPQPNFVVIEVDDQSLHTFSREVMPSTFRLLVDGGTEFTQGIATPPICCPSRAGFLTGQYPHNHGVFANDPGYPDLVGKNQVLPVWLQEEGYRTGVVGKYLNRVKDTHGDEPAPGWDHWETVDSKSYRNGKINLNGVIHDKVPYLPRALNKSAVTFIEDSAEAPFFLWLTQFPPHIRKHEPDPTGNCPGRDAKPLGRDFRDVGDVPFPRLPSFNERDVTDKPVGIQALRRLSPKQREATKLSFRCAAGSMRIVDRGVHDVWRALKAAGIDDNTVVIYTSDNGLFFGEHRLRGGKGRIYEEAVRVPLAMRVPDDVLGERAKRHVRTPTANIDLTPTILDIAGAEPCSAPGSCRLMDGSSATPLLRGDAQADDRALLFEQGLGGCKLLGLRTTELVYAVDRIPAGGDGCSDGEIELYLLDEDPFQLENVAGEPEYAQLESELRRRLKDLRGCEGTEGAQSCE